MDDVTSTDLMFSESLRDVLSRSGQFHQALHGPALLQTDLECRTGYRIEDDPRLTLPPRAQTQSSCERIIGVDLHR